MMLCKDGNDRQKKEWKRVVKMANMRGDPFDIEEGVRWAGGHLWRCRSHE